MSVDSLVKVDQFEKNLNHGETISLDFSGVWDWDKNNCFYYAVANEVQSSLLIRESLNSRATFCDYPSYFARPKLLIRYFFRYISTKCDKNIVIFTYFFWVTFTRSHFHWILMFSALEVHCWIPWYKTESKHSWLIKRS